MPGENFTPRSVQKGLQPWFPRPQNGLPQQAELERIRVWGAAPLKEWMRIGGNEKRLFKGSVARCIMNLALPMTAAQLINVLYSVVDRMYIGHLPEASTLALTGIGLTFPIISIITAFTQLFSAWAARRCAPSRARRGQP